MSNSSLVAYTKISPNKNSPRKYEIDTVTIHCVVGQVTAESLGNWFAKESTQASSNYGVDKDGRIGMYVEEKDRSWCTSSGANDHRAITIEVASDTKEPYAVTDKAYNALIELLADICRRNPGIKKLRWKGDKSLIGQVDKQNMTVHRWFANKSCPGEYLYSRHADIAAKVNALLEAGEEKPATEEKKTAFKEGDIVKITGNQYYSGKSVPSWVKAKNWVVHSASETRVVINKSVDGANSIMSPFKPADLALVSSNKVEGTKVEKKVAYAKSRNDSLAGAYIVTASDGLNLRYTPGVLTDDNVILALPKGAVVRNYGYFTAVNGVNWLYVAYKDKVGFIHSGYVKKS